MCQGRREKQHLSYLLSWDEKDIEGECKEFSSRVRASSGKQ